MTAHPAAAARADRPNLTVVGLGPAGPELINTATRVALDRADAAFLRTRRHPAAAGLGCDDVLRPPLRRGGHLRRGLPPHRRGSGRCGTAMAPAAGAGGVVYAVPGSPLVAERTVELLRADPRVAVTVVPALSFLDLAWDRLGVDPLAAGVRLVDGTRFAVEAAGERGPLLVAQCWSTQVLSEIKLSVDTDLLGELPSATVLHHLGLPDEQVETVRLGRARPGPRPRPPDLGVDPPADGAEWPGSWWPWTTWSGRLRRECPWDREQTHASLTRHLLEEAYEVIDAVDELTRAEEGADRREPAARRPAMRSSTWKRSSATCSSRSTSTPAWPPRRAGSPWPMWPGGSTTSWWPATPMSSATWWPTIRPPWSPTGRRSRRPRRAARVSPTASRPRCRPWPWRPSWPARPARCREWRSPASRRNGRGHGRAGAAPAAGAGG